MIRSVQNIVVVLLFLSHCFAGEKETPITNREVFFRLCDSTMSGLATEAFVKSRSVYLTAGHDTITNYFQNQFLQNLASRNIDVFVRVESTETTLALNVREASVIYGDAFTESFLGSRKTERKVTLSVSGVVITNNDGKVAWSGSITKTYSDTVLYAAIEQLNAGNPPVTAYSIPELSFFDSILEPAIVTIASGVAIYLFFTIRS
ncbi:MAG: hypothetical protein WCW40_07975 [Bacteroidota bacterium]